jgi:hypothetical protein
MMLTLRVLGRRLAAQQSELLRCYSKSAALVIDDFGVPEKVLKLHDYEVPSPEKLGDNEVLINILAVRLLLLVRFLCYGNLEMDRCDFLNYLPTAHKNYANLLYSLCSLYNRLQLTPPTSILSRENTRCAQPYQRPQVTKGSEL